MKEGRHFYFYIHYIIAKLASCRELNDEWKVPIKWSFSITFWILFMIAKLKYSN